MSPTDHNRTSCAESLLVLLARQGDSKAFEELVRRRQSWMRNLMRRLSGNAALADDLAQQVFIQLWRTLGQLSQAERFSGWLKRMAINTWLQHVRRNDPLAASEDLERFEGAAIEAHGTAIDVDHALSVLPGAVRLCIVLSYHERMSHAEIAEATGLALGTVKSHIRRGTERLQLLLVDYAGGTATGVSR